MTLYNKARNDQWEQADVCMSIIARYGTGGGNIPVVKERESKNIVNEKTYVVRRLTPLECTRLQGYPDGWVDIGDWVDSKGKKHKDADSAKYKALGNSIALPFWYQLLGNISEVLRRDDPMVQTHTMGSLFSGIGGFDYCWAMHNGKASVRWESEIEEYPMAVTAKHFGDEDWGTEGDFDEYFG